MRPIEGNTLWRMSGVRSAVVSGDGGDEARPDGCAQCGVATRGIALGEARKKERKSHEVGMEANSLVALCASKNHVDSVV